MSASFASLYNDFVAVQESSKPYVSETYEPSKVVAPENIIESNWHIIEQCLLLMQRWDELQEFEMTALHMMMYSSGATYLHLSMGATYLDAVKIVTAFGSMTAGLGRITEMGQLDREILRIVPPLADFAIYVGCATGLVASLGANVEGSTAQAYVPAQLNRNVPPDEVAERVIQEINSSAKPLETFTSVQAMQQHKRKLDLENAHRAVHQHRGAEYLSATFSHCVSDVAAMVSGRTMVYVAASPNGGSAISFTPEGALIAVQLPHLTSDWLRQVRSEIETVFELSAQSAIGRKAIQRRLKKVLEDVGSRVMEPILNAHRDEFPLCLIPVNDVVHLPLSTALVDGRPAVAWKDITLSPNGRSLLLAALHDSDTAPDTLSAFVAADPSEGRNPITGVLPEARRIAAIYGTEPVTLDSESGGRDTSSHSSILHGITQSDVVHLACHGIVEDFPISESHLLLGEHVTMNELLEAGVKPNSAFFLSACSVGGVVPSFPSELLGFPASILTAGASSVTASLWPVPDCEETVAFVEHVHLKQKSGSTAASAFRDAVIGATDNDVDLHVWAGFAVYGT
ncbi:CHAT domain-containing protein [Rhodococcus fascians]|nr:CHAT domain-containing protein [Rhodococcus fascians]MBY4114875.1 CHAT domain-containing protein [Rhodococcus fascians]